MGWIGIVAVLSSASCTGAQRPADTAARTAQVSPRARHISPYSYEWFIRAELLRASGDLNGAVEAYRAAWTGGDSSPHVMARLGSAFVQLGQLDRAQRVLSEAIELDPDADSVWLAQAELFERRADLDAALTALQRAQAAAPDEARPVLEIARLLRKHGWHERARAVLEAWQARGTTSISDRQRAELERALAPVEHGVRAQADSADIERVFEATLPYRLGTLAAPAPLIQRAAQAALTHGRPALALRLLELIPESVRDPSLELRVLNEAGSASAIEAYFVRHEPESDPEGALDSPERLLTMRVLLAVGKWREAERLLEAEGRAPGDVPQLQLIAAEIALARGAYARAAELFSRVPPESSAAEPARLGHATALSALGLSTSAAELRN